MSVSIFNEQADWPGDSELAVNTGKEINHVAPEDIRKLLYLFRYYMTDSRKISRYKNDRDFFDDIFFDYQAESRSDGSGSPPGVDYTELPLWSRQSRHKYNFLYGKNHYGDEGDPQYGDVPGSAWVGGGTVWYQNDYIHSCTFLQVDEEEPEVEGYEGEMLIVVGNGSDFQEDITDRSISGYNGYSRYNRFKEGTPVTIDSDNNKFTARISERIIDGGTFYLTVEAINPVNELVPDEGSGTISCWFGGDYYMTNKDFEWNDCHFRQTNPYYTWNMNDKDSRPPDGGFLSEDSNEWWCRTVNPYLYHHFDENSHRWVAYTYTFSDGLHLGKYHTSQKYESSKYFPVQLDPREQDDPNWYTEDERGNFKYNPVELKAEQITIPTKLGPVDDWDGEAFTGASGTDYAIADGDDMYTGFTKETVSSTGYMVITEHYDPGTIQTIESDLYGEQTVFIPSEKFSTSGISSYQQLAEFYCSTDPFRTFVPDSGGGGYASDFRDNWEYYYEEDFSDDKQVTKTNFPSTKSDFFGCNGSTFEMLLYKLDEFDWYYSDKYYVPRNVAEKYTADVLHGAGDRYALPIGSWRKTWRYTCGRISKFMSSTDPQHNDDSDTANDWGIRRYPNDPDASPTPSYSCKFPGDYVEEKPKASCFRTSGCYRTISSRSGNELTLSASVDLPVGACVQFYTSDGDIDDYVSVGDNGFGLYVLKCDGTKVLLSDTPPDSGIMQWDTGIIARHDPIQVINGTPKFTLRPEILHHIRDVLLEVEYRTVVATVQTAIGYWNTTEDYRNPYDSASAAFSGAIAFLAKSKNDDPESSPGTFNDGWSYGTPVGVTVIYDGAVGFSPGDYYNGLPGYASSVSTFAIKLSEEEMPDFFKIFTNVSYVYGNASELWNKSDIEARDMDTPSPGPSTMDGFRSLRFSIAGKSFGPDNPLFNSSGEITNNGDYEYGFIDFVYENDKWLVVNFTTAAQSTWTYEDGGTVEEQYSYNETTINFSGGSREFGIEMDYNRYSSAIWTRDYTHADFYYDELDENNPPWPNPAQFNSSPSIVGYDAPGIIADIKECGDNYFLIDSPYIMLVDTDIIRISGSPSGAWDGDYTVESKEYYNVYVDAYTNTTLAKINVVETIPTPHQAIVWPDPPWDPLDSYGVCEVLSYWEIEVEFKLAEDWEGDDPVEYKFLGVFGDESSGSGSEIEYEFDEDYDSEWTTSRTVSFYIGETEDLLFEFNNNNLENLYLQPVTRDSSDLDYSGGSGSASSSEYGLETKSGEFYLEENPPISLYYDDAVYYCSDCDEWFLVGEDCDCSA